MFWIFKNFEFLESRLSTWNNYHSLKKQIILGKIIKKTENKENYFNRKLKQGQLSTVERIQVQILILTLALWFWINYFTHPSFRLSFENLK